MCSATSSTRCWLEASRIMPLHEWSDRMGWEGFHTLWLTELLRWIKPRLPVGYRAYIGSPPTLAIGGPSERPDVGVRQWIEEQPAQPPSSQVQHTGDGEIPSPDIEVAVATLEPGTALQIELHGR